MLELLTVVLLLLVVYHHVGYPLALRLIASLKTTDDNLVPIDRGFRSSNFDSNLPSVHLVVPAFNEESVIRQKVDSMAWLDYPDDKLTISILCDGCNDATVREAMTAHQRFMNRDLDVHVINFHQNRGKIAMVNIAIASTEADLLAFSDASAIMAADTIWRSARHFMHDNKLGVITGDYKLLTSGSAGESAYWQYQNRVRSLESQLGAVMGAPGAFYMIRHELCSDLEPDTINDDFILPMRAVAAGFKARFDHDIHIYETEPTSLDDDAKRRLRISRGNMQQLIRLWRLLVPGLGNQEGGKQGFWVSWMFLSGKCLRVLMPFILILLLLLSAWLAPVHWFFLLLLLGQLAVYLCACTQPLVIGLQGGIKARLLNKIFDNRLVRLVSYLCQGHLMGLIGSASYLKSVLSKSHSHKSW